MSNTVRILFNVENAAAPYLDRWLDAARAVVETAPSSECKRLVNGVTDSIEVPEADGLRAREWAETLDGWSDAPSDLRPLLFEKVGGGAWFAPS